MNKEGGWKSPEHVKGDLNHATGVFKNSPKPLRYSKDSFIKELIGKKIRISLVNQEVFEGTLKELGMYDVLVEIRNTEKINVAGKEITREATKQRIFMKAHIVWAEVI